ncbi:PST family polysaccharide transporter [Luteimonas sp. RC10]|nr:PST family polysaccharide transporter [Luteimonas sp. RC10]
MTAQVAVILIQMASIVILSRILRPEDFGVIAMILAITAFVGLFRDMGLSTASIQKTDLTREQASALFWFNLLVGGVLMMLVMALAPIIAWFYKRPELTQVCIAISTTFIIASAGAQHAALLQRELRFKPKAIADVCGAVVNLLVSILLALKGMRFWALAWGTVFGALTTTLLYLLLSGFKPVRPQAATGLRQIFGFGANVTAFELLNYFSRNLDSILIGKLWGAEQLGFYSRAYQMMMLPITSLRTPINAVAFPVLSRLQHDQVGFRRYYCRIASLLAFLSMPMMGFLTVKSEQVVEIALGREWIEVAPVFALLGVTGFIQPVASLRGLVLLSLGKSRRYLAWGGINAITVTIAFCIGIRWGNIGIAWAYLIVNYALIYPSLLFIFNQTPLRPRDFFDSIKLPFLASVVAIIIVFFWPSRWKTDQMITQTIIDATVFAAAFLGTYAVSKIGRDTIAGYLRLLSTLKPNLTLSK